MTTGLYTVERDSKELQRKGVTLDGMDFESGTGTIEKIDNTELLPDLTDITTVIPTLDSTLVRESMCIVDNKVYIAGQELSLSINYWGQLQGKLGKYKIKGSTWKAIIRELYDNHFDKHSEIVVDSKWSIINGNFTFSKKLAVKLLARGETFIGFFTENTKVSKTINYYEKAVFKGTMINYNRVHKTVDYKAETVHEVYDTLAPEFTKENELEEIREFITSLKRRLSNEEVEILVDIRSELNKILGE